MWKNAHKIHHHNRLQKCTWGSVTLSIFPLYRQPWPLSSPQNPPIVQNWPYTQQTVTPHLPFTPVPPFYLWKPPVYLCLYEFAQSRHLSGIKEYMSSRDWLTLLSKTSSRFIHVVACVGIFLLGLDNIPLDVQITLCLAIYLSGDTWVASIFGLLWTRCSELGCVGTTPSFLPCRYIQK